MNYKITKYKNIYIGDDYNIYKLQKNGVYHKLCQWVDNTGYYQIAFRVDGKKKYIRVHRLLAETLISNPNSLSQVNHKDGNKLNNDIQNLEWISNSDNTKHAYESGLYNSNKRSHKIKVTDKKTRVETIYKSIRNCSEALSLNRKTITSILKGQKVNNYPYEFKYV